MCGRHVTEMSQILWTNPSELLWPNQYRVSGPPPESSPAFSPAWKLDFFHGRLRDLQCHKHDICHPPWDWGVGWYSITQLDFTGKLRSQRAQVQEGRYWGLAYMLWFTGSHLRVCACSVTQMCPTLCDPLDCSPSRLLCPWDFPGKHTGEGLPFLSPGDLPDPAIEPPSLTLADRSFTTELLGKPIFGTSYIWFPNTRFSSKTPKSCHSRVKGGVKLQKCIS